MNAISKQIRAGEYAQPYAHKHLNNEIIFSDEIHNEIKVLELEGNIDLIKQTYSSEIIKAHRFGYLLEQM